MISISREVFVQNSHVDWDGKTQFACEVMWQTSFYQTGDFVQLLEKGAGSFEREYLTISYIYLTYILNIEVIILNLEPRVGKELPGQRREERGSKVVFSN